MRDFMTSLAAYRDRRMIRILLLGAMSGFPWVLIGSSLSLWLSEDGLSRSAIGWAGLIFSIYAINFFWAPLIDRIQDTRTCSQNWPAQSMDFMFPDCHSFVASGLEPASSGGRYLACDGDWACHCHRVSITRYHH